MKKTNQPKEIMKSNIKETLIKKLHDINFDVYEKCHYGVASADFVGNNDIHFAKALKYVQNHILKKWIKNCKEEIKKTNN